MGLFDMLASRRLIDTMHGQLAGLEDAEWARWCEQWRALHKYFENQHLERTRVKAHAAFENAAQDWDEGNGAGYRFYPLVRMVAERLAVTFSRPADTYLHRGDYMPLPEDDPQTRQWRIDETSVRVAEKTKLIEELETVLGQVAVSPVWRSSQMQWDVVEPYNLRVAQSSRDPKSLSRAAAIQLRLPKPKRVVAFRPDQWLSWEYDERMDPASPDAWHVLLRDTVGTGGKPSMLFGGPNDDRNEYGMHPVVLWQFREPASDDIWVPPDEVLLQTQDGLNLDITDMHHGMKYGSHPQWVKYGTGPTKNQVMGPGRLFEMYDSPGNAKLEAITPDLNTDEQRSTVEWDMQMYAVALGFPPDTFSPNSSTRNLGAKLQEAAQLKLRREAQQPLAKRALAATWDVHRTVANYWAKRGARRTLYQDDVQLGVDLKPVPQVSDRLQEQQARELELGRDLSSAIEQEMQDSGTSRLEAAARIQRRRLDNAGARPPTA